MPSQLHAYIYLPLNLSLYPHAGVACCSLCEDDSDADVEEDDLECTCKYACLICCCGCVLIPVSVTGVALLGWSSLNG